DQSGSGSETLVDDGKFGWAALNGVVGAQSVYGYYLHAPFDVGVLRDYSGILSQGAITVGQIAAPTPTLTATCTGVCATSYTLYLVGRDWNGGVTAEAASNTITNGPATLSGTNYVTLCWTAVDGLEKWDILSDTSHSIATNQNVPLIGTTQCYKYTGGSLTAYAGDWNTTDNLHRRPRDINVLP